MNFFSKKGLTVIELLVVLVIIFILVSMCIDQFDRFLMSYRLKAVARIVRSDFLYARSLAIKNGFQYRLAFASSKMIDGTGAYEIQKGSAKKNSSYEASYQDSTFFVRNLSKYKGIIIARYTNNPIFNPNGTVTSLATITLQNIYGKKIKISTSIAGRIKIK